MTRLTHATRLRVFIGDDDTYGNQPLCDVILATAREARLAGVTVFRGVAGFGRSAYVHEVFRGFSHDLPIVLEIVDTAERIEAWLPILRELLRGGFVTMEPIQIVTWPQTAQAA